MYFNDISENMKLRTYFATDTSRFSHNTTLQHISQYRFLLVSWNKSSVSILFTDFLRPLWTLFLHNHSYRMWNTNTLPAKIHLITGVIISLFASRFVVDTSSIEQCLKNVNCDMNMTGSELSSMWSGMSRENDDKPHVGKPVCQTIYSTYIFPQPSIFNIYTQLKCKSENSKFGCREQASSVLYK